VIITIPGKKLDKDMRAVMISLALLKLLYTLGIRSYTADDVAKKGSLLNGKGVDEMMYLRP